MGRAPGTALAYMYWCKNFQLMEAHKLLTGLRACNPKLTAIRAATCDILFDGKGTAPVRIAVSRSKAGLAQRVQVQAYTVYKLVTPVTASIVRMHVSVLGKNDLLCLRRILLLSLRLFRSAWCVSVPWLALAHNSQYCVCLSAPIVKSASGLTHGSVQMVAVLSAQGSACSDN